jgi:cell wall-associated NlpC family hydrolase
LYLLDKGLDPLQVAAILGNIALESWGADFGAVERESGEGIGICQWSFGRKTQLMAYAQNCGKPWSDQAVQLDFLWAEIADEGPAAAFATKAFNLAQLMALSDLEEATMYFGRMFEAPREETAHWDQRVEQAYRVYIVLLQGLGARADGSTRAIPSDRVGKIVFFATRGNLYGWTSGYCAGWVWSVYSQAGIVLPAAGCATELKWATERSMSLSAIQPGALIFSGNNYISQVRCGNHDAGHVGIYIGGGQVADNSGRSTPTVSSLDAWVRYYGFGGWGF